MNDWSSPSRPAFSRATVPAQTSREAAEAADTEASILAALAKLRERHADLNVRARSAEISETIFVCLRDAIERGELRARQRLPAEREMMRTFAAPRGPVRRAFQKLKASGLVERRVGSGTYVSDQPRLSRSPVDAVASISPQDVIEARLALEPGLAEFVVARGAEDNFLRMEAWLARAENALDQRTFREAMYSFHNEMARATRNPLLVEIFRLIVTARAQAGWEKLQQMNYTRDSQSLIIASAREIIRAFRDRKSRKARQLLREHLRRVVLELAGMQTS